MKKYYANAEINSDEKHPVNGCSFERPTYEAAIWAVARWVARQSDARQRAVLGTLEIKEVALKATRGKGGQSWKATGKTWCFGFDTNFDTFQLSQSDVH